MGLSVPPIDRDRNLIDALLSEHRDLAVATAFFRSAKATVGFRPDRVTTSGHGSYPKAIRAILGRAVRHRTSAYLNNRPEQDHRDIQGRIRCMRGFKSEPSASRFCREHGELRDLLRCRRRHNHPFLPPPVFPASPEPPLSRSASCKPPELQPDHHPTWPERRDG
jgi:putative transposase